MLSRKVPNTVLINTPNLTSVILPNNPTNKYYSFRYKFTMRDIAVSDVLKSIRNVKEKIKLLLDNDMVLRALRDTLITVPRTLKNQSAGVLRVWAHQCECVVAQRLRRSQQMFCLYTKLWEERALKELLTRMRQQITKRGKELVFSAVGVATYNWDANRISTDEIVKHINELDYIHLLTEKTVVCDACKKSTGEKVQAPFCACGMKASEKKTFDNWAPFIEKPDMLVWRRLHDSGHYEYKVYGSFNDVSAEDFLNVQIDSAYRKKWDNTAVILEVVEKDPTPQSNSDIIYWEMLWPKLFTNRDYVFNRRFMIDCKNKTIVIMSRGTKHSARPVRTDKFRVDNYWSYMVIKPYKDLHKAGIEFGLTYYDNPGVNIPASITTWVAMKAMPDFLMRLRAATKKYREYCASTGSNCMYSIKENHCQMSASKSPAPAKPDKSGPKAPMGAKKKLVAVEHKSGSGGTSDLEIMTSPSPMIQADSDRRNYWKYLHPNYYFS